MNNNNLAVNSSAACLFNRSLWLICTALSVFHSAHAQTPPDAGVLQRELEQNTPKLPPKSSVPKPLPTPADDKTHQPQVLVKQFQINGNHLVDSPPLLALLQDQVGKSLSFSELQQLAQRLSEHYRSLGWFARAYLPEQDVSSGVIQIQVIEGKFGGSKLEDTDTRADTAFINRMVTGDIEPGQPMPAQRLESGLLLANDLSGIKTTGTLEAGEQVGETRLKLKVEDKPLLSGDIGYSNNGIRSTGSNQYQAGFNINDPLGYGDQFSARAVGSEFMVSVRGQYATTLTSDGLRLAVYGSHLDYELGGSFANLQANGESRTIGGLLSYPLIRQTQRNLNISAGIENRQMHDFTLGSASRRRNLDTFNLTLSGDQVDDVLDGAVSQASLRLILGRLHINDVGTDLSSDRLGPNANGDYQKLGLNLSRLQNLDQDWQLSLALSGQWAAKNLDSSEKFSLGGPFGIRAYPVNEGMGDAGWMVNFEVRRNLGYGFQGLIFADTGGVELHQSLWSNALGSSGIPNYYNLSGVGMGLRWSQPGAWQLGASVALPLSDNPGRDRFNHNADGSRSTDPVGWLTLTRVF